MLGGGGGGGGDQRRISMDIDPAAQDIQNGGHSQHPEPIVNHSKKLQDDLNELGRKVKQHEENFKYLKSLKIKLDESILGLQAAHAKYDKASFPKAVNRDSIHAKTEEEITEHILEHEKSAAAILCRIKSEAEVLSIDPEVLSIDHSLTKDVIGIVATLGKVDDDNLSRLLSEYLGTETMLGVVCSTYEGVKALEAYNKGGSINKSFGLHAFAASVEGPLAQRFLVICLENIRPYAGEFISDDPQRRLALPNPRLPNGETPRGFLGFAVNMITIEGSNLYCISKNGNGLRETLFYNLFSSLQVYRSREDMLEALSCIKNGAVCLDGGIIRSSGVFSLGRRHEGGIDIKFPVCSEKSNCSLSYMETEKMKETTWKKDRICEDMKREQALLEHARSKYETKKVEFLQFQSSLHVSQNPVVGRGSTQR